MESLYSEVHSPGEVHYLSLGYLCLIVQCTVKRKRATETGVCSSCARVNYASDLRIAKITCVDPSKIAESFAGCECDLSLLNALPAGADPCGENGEFHTFAYDARCFLAPIEVLNGEVVERNAIDLCLLIFFRSD